MNSQSPKLLELMSEEKTSMGRDTGKRRYQTEWELRFPWAQYDHSKNRPICVVCDQTLGLNKALLSRHERTSKHIENFERSRAQATSPRSPLAPIRGSIAIEEETHNQEKKSDINREVSSKINETYNREWDYIYPWIQQDSRTKRPWCIVCCQLLTCSGHHLNRHEATIKHKKHMTAHPDSKTFLKRKKDYKAVQAVDKHKENKAFLLRRYRHSWEQTYPWLKRDPKTNRPLCSICCQLLGKQKCHLSRHEKTQKHKRQLANNIAGASSLSQDSNRKEGSITKSSCHESLSEENKEEDMDEQADKQRKENNEKLQQKYLGEWEFIYPWVECEPRTQLPFCRPCNQLIGGHRSHLSRHERSNKHQENMAVAEEVITVNEVLHDDDGDNCDPLTCNKQNLAMVTLKQRTADLLNQMTTIANSMSRTPRSTMKQELDPVAVCRICLQGGEDEMNSIYESDPMDKTLRIYQKIERCGGIKILNDPELPTRICRKCNMFLTIVHKFRTMCQHSDGYLRQFVCKATPNGEQQPAANGAVQQQQHKPTKQIPQANTRRRRSPPSTATTPTKGNATHAAQRSSNAAATLHIKDEEAEAAAADCTEFWPDEMDSDEDEEHKEYLPVEGDMAAEDDDEDVGGGGGGDEEPEHQDVEDEAHNELDQADDDDDDDESSQRESEYSPRPAKTLGISSDGAAVISVKPLPAAKDKHVCDVCGNSYPRRYALESHMRWHSHEKPFECEICHASFHMNFQLIRHLRRHTGARPYSCQYCQRTFTDRSTLVKHERIHRNERPYACTTCDKTFSYSSVLKAHILTHTGEKPYSCGICGKRFTRAHHLRAHLETLMHSNDPRSKELLKRIKPEGEQTYTVDV